MKGSEMKRSPTVLCAMLVTLLALTLCGHTGADTITFSGLPGPNQSPFTTYAEAGFTVAAAGGSPQQGTLFGNPAPSVIIAAPVGAPVVGTVQTTLTAGGTFTFTSVDLASNNGEPSNFRIRGLLGGVEQYSFPGSIPSGSDPLFFFVTQGNPFSGVLIDTLQITVAPGNGTTSDNLDNIVVNAVPEPGTAMLLVVGGALAYRRIRRWVSS
jgi:PEP-CTERM motif